MRIYCNRRSGTLTIMTIRRSESRRILDAVRTVVRELRLAATAMAREHGITAAQAFVIEVLDRSPGISMTALAEKTLTDQSSVSVIVQRLTETGLVSKTRSTADARSFVVQLTPAGRAVARRLPAVPQQRLVDALQRLPPRKRRELAGLLDEWLAAVDLDTEHAPMLFEDPPRSRRRA